MDTLPAPTDTSTNEGAVSADMVFRPGELVDITIRGARVHDSSKPIATHDLLVVYLADVWVDLRDAKQEATRVAPAEWPPRYGDMWRDAEGDLWTMGRDVSVNDSLTRPRFVCLELSVRGFSNHHQVLVDRGPMTLVYREPRYAATIAAPEDGVPS